MGIGTSYKVEASRQKWTNEPLREALHLNWGFGRQQWRHFGKTIQASIRAPSGSASLSWHTLRSLGFICNITSLRKLFVLFGVESYSGRVLCVCVCLFDPLCFLWNKSCFNRSALGSSFEFLTQSARQRFSSQVSSDLWKEWEAHNHAQWKMRIQVMSQERKGICCLLTRQVSLSIWSHLIVAFMVDDYLLYVMSEIV